MIMLDASPSCGFVLFYESDFKLLKDYRGEVDAAMDASSLVNIVEAAVTLSTAPAIRFR